MGQPFFSVIIPTLNEEEYLPRLLKNLTRQTEKSFEVFVVDGGSSDRTVALAKTFTSKMPLCISSAEKNVCVQRNLGAKLAGGEFLVFLDADVQIPRRFLEKLRGQILAKGGDFFTTWLRPDSRVVYDQVIAQFANSGMELSAFLDRPLIGGYDMIVRRHVFMESGGFREDIRHAEDVDLALRLHQSGHPLKVIRSPRLVWSLRRYRAEGRLKVMRKNAKAGLHILTKGPITKDIFNWPMGGGWYKTSKVEKVKLDRFRRRAEIYMKKFFKAFFAT